MEALEDIPKIEGPLLTEKGDAVLQKTDIFRKIMWFGFNEENTWYPLNIQRVNEILRMNKEGRKPANLEKDVEAEKIPVATLNSDLARMDQKFKGKAKKRKKKKPSAGGGEKPQQQQNPPQQAQQQRPNPRGNRGGHQRKPKPRGPQ
jgi:hypothetical protein